MINVTLALGADKETALKEMRKVLEFEINLYKVCIQIQNTSLIHTSRHYQN